MSLIQQAIANNLWAITDDGLQKIVAVSSREGDLSSLEKTLGQKPKGSDKATVRDGVGIISIQGPLIKRANLLSDISGATSYELVLRDFYALLGMDGLRAILFNVDSPGGEANGCAELAENIYAARGRVPILSYVSGTCASAAYWIASATDAIYASETAIVGSIGVQTAIPRGNPDESLRFVSSQTPNKNRDPESEDGAKEVQRVVDDLAAVFIGKVARNRSLPVETVQQSFGQGSIYVGVSALQRGMIDEISTFEGLMQKLEKDKTEPGLTVAIVEAMHPEIAAHFRSQGRTEAEAELKLKTEMDRKRAEDIRRVCAGRVPSDLCQELIDLGLPLEAVDRIVTKSLSKEGQGLKAIEDSERLVTGLNSKPKDHNSDPLDDHMKLAKEIGLSVRI